MNIIYPDGSKEEVTEEFLENGSDLQRKWFPLSYIRAVMPKERKGYKGTLGVTSVLNGMRLNWLKYHVHPDIDPDNSLFMITGINAHSAVEDATPDRDVSEEWLKQDGLIVGRSDLLEQMGDYNILVDNKFSGSYKIAKAAGVEEQPAVDEFGHPILYQRSGKGYKKGDQKKIKVLTFDPKKTDNFEHIMQMNQYRRMYEKQGVKIDEMRLFYGARDGGTYTSEGYGLTRKTYYIKVPKLPDAEVDEYFHGRAEKIDEMLRKTEHIQGTPEEVVEQVKQEGIEIPICDETENWSGRRCEKYCAYASACALFGDNPYLAAPGGREETI